MNRMDGRTDGWMGMDGTERYTPAFAMRARARVRNNGHMGRRQVTYTLLGAAGRLKFGRPTKPTNYLLALGCVRLPT